MGVERMFLQRIFSNKKECNYSEKLIFLINQTHKWFNVHYQNKTKNRVDIPYMVYADFATKEEIFKVVKENRVNECFKKCVEEMLNKGQVRELQVYGII